METRPIAKVELLIKWSEHPYFKQENIKMPFNIGTNLIKMLDKYMPLDIGYFKTSFEIIFDNKSLYEGRIDIGDGNYIESLNENYGIYEHVKQFTENSLKRYVLMLDSENFENMTKDEIQNNIENLKCCLENIIPVLEQNSIISQNEEMKLNILAFNQRFKIIAMNDFKDIVWKNSENIRLTKIFEEYKKKNIQENIEKLLNSLKDEDKLKK